MLPPIYWLELYESIRSVLGYSISEDLYAARVAEAILLEKGAERLASLGELCSMLEKRVVCIAGGSAELEKEISLLDNCERIVVADGASTLLYMYSYTPDIVVTDLDGAWSTLIHLSRQGTPFVIHAHGDNVHALKHLLPVLIKNAPILLSLQVKPLIGIGRVVGGFTDGDRAVVLAVACNARKILLLGMNFRGKTGWWSKPWLKNSVRPWPEKRRKLALAEKIVSIITHFALVNGVEVVTARSA